MVIASIPLIELEINDTTYTVLSFMTYHRIFNKSNTTGANKGAGTV